MAAVANHDDAEYKDLGRGLARLEERIDGLRTLFDRSFDRLEKTIEELADRFNGDVDQFRDSMNGLTDLTRRVGVIEQARNIQQDHIDRLLQWQAQSRVVQWIVQIAVASLVAAAISIIKR